MNQKTHESGTPFESCPAHRSEFRSKVSATLLRPLLTSAVVLVAVAFAPAPPANAGTDPAAFINNLGNQLQMVTSNPSREQRVAAFRRLFDQDFDVPGLGRFVLGRFWRILAPSEQQEFLGLFANYVVVTFSDRLSEFTSGIPPRVIGSRPDADGAIVFSEIARGPTAQPIKVDWRLTGQNGVYKISDVIINGLSLAASGRSQMQGVAERNGGQPRAILAVMRQESTNAALR